MNDLIQKGFSYLMHTREEKLFVSMQQRLQQAAINDRERRTLLAQLESHVEGKKVLVTNKFTHVENIIDYVFCRETLLSLILLVVVGFKLLNQLPKYVYILCTVLCDM